MIAFTKYDGPLAYPSRCVCGSAKRPVVDTHIEIPAWGHVYLCELCLRQSVAAFGLWVEKQEHDDALSQLAEQRDIVDRLRAELEAARDPAQRTITAGELVAYMAQQQQEVQA